MKVLIIIPAFNEADTIQEVIAGIGKQKLENADVLVVNDASTDNTSSLAKKHAVKVIDLPVNLGIGGATQTGYLYAYYHDYDIAVQVDGDGQHRPEFIVGLIEPIIKSQADLVIGSRFIEFDGFQSSFFRKLGIKILQIVIKLTTGKVVTDPTSGFRACNRNVFSVFVKYYPADFPEPESFATIVRNGYRVKEIPVIMDKRLGGKSSISSFKTIYYMIKVSLAIALDRIKKLN